MSSLTKFQSIPFFFFFDILSFSTSLRKCSTVWNLRNVSYSTFANMSSCMPQTIRNAQQVLTTSAQERKVTFPFSLLNVALLSFRLLYNWINPGREEGVQNECMQMVAGGNFYLYTFNLTAHNILECSPLFNSLFVLFFVELYFVCSLASSIDLLIQWRYSPKGTGTSKTYY